MYKVATSMLRVSKSMTGAIVELSPNAQHLNLSENKDRKRYKDKPIQSGVSGNQFCKPTLGSAKKLLERR